MDIPNKALFKINEVCGIAAVKPYVLRFWESEFDEISPVSTSSGQKMFLAKDVRTIKRIKELVFEEKLTIEEAKERLNPVYSEEMQGELQELSPEYAQEAPQGELQEGSDTKGVEDIECHLREFDSVDAVEGPIISQELLEVRQKLRSMVAMADTLKQHYNWN